MRVPSLIVIGGMKCGTTTLYQYLRSFENISSSSLKEPSFFDDLRWDRGFEWYKSLFKDDKTFKFEASTIYSKYPAHKDIPARMYEALPNIKLVYLVREPVDRLISQIRHNVSAGNISPDYLGSEDFWLNDFDHYINCSRYYLQIEQYLNFFPKSQLHLVKSEALWGNPDGIVNEIIEFWGIDAGTFSEKGLKSVYNPGIQGVRTHRKLHRLATYLEERRIFPGMRRLFEKEWELPEYFRSKEFHDRCFNLLSEDMKKFSEFSGLTWSDRVPLR